MVPQLNYPLLPDTAHAAGEGDSYHFRLVVPPVASLFKLPRCYWVSLVVILLLVTSHVLAVVMQPTRKVAEFFPGAISDGVCVFFLCGMAYLRTHRWATFEITADRFRFYSRVFHSESLRLDFSRSQILEIRLNRSNGKLILRVHRQEMREIFIGVDRQAAARVVDQLREAMAVAFEKLPGALEEPVTPAHIPATANQRQFTMRAVTVVTVGVFGFWWIWPTGATILLVLTCAVSIPMGIMFGTQKKDFFP